jgi:hypothetical protein
MADDIPPGATQGFRFSFTGRGVELGSGLDVPLRLWRSAAYPDGLVFGETNGVSWGDFDADGFIDVFACQSGNLWRNLGGTDWELTADLDVFLPVANRRYGSSFGDYDGDGKPDLGTEPRLGFGGDGCFHLLHNLGMATFVDVAEDPALVDALLCGLSETICWGDTDDDGDLDMFLPVYPPWAFNGPGNFFLENLGPSGPGGQFRFTETSAAAGLDNPPPNSARPEGAQFCDVDFDGDIDLYSNGHLYQNQSTTTPSFAAMTETGSGIGLSTRLDEGAMFFDYDLDGDYDLAIVYTSGGVKIWESFGDGNFFDVEAGVIQNPGAGLDLGMSAEDWDNDGDIDFSTRHVFRRNMLVEQGIRHFAVATLDIPIEHRSSATPAWGDWDGDGDLDCCRWREGGVTAYADRRRSADAVALDRAPPPVA